MNDNVLVEDLMSKLRVSARPSCGIPTVQGTRNAIIGDKLHGQIFLVTARRMMVGGWVAVLGCVASAVFYFLFIFGVPAPRHARDGRTPTRRLGWTSKNDARRPGDASAGGESLFFGENGRKDNEE